MLNKIAVHRNAILVRVQIHPIWLNINYTVTLLQNENIACDLCACVGTECVIWQTDCAQQLGSLGDIHSYLWACFVHCSLRGNEHHNAAGTDFIKRLCEKVIVYEELLGVVSAVVHTDFSERHIADNYIKMVVWELCLLKALYGNVGFLVELLCDFTRQRV